jgi:hypothetical protein
MIGEGLTGKGASAGDCRVFEIISPSDPPIPGCFLPQTISGVFSGFTRKIIENVRISFTRGGKGGSEGEN